MVKITDKDLNSMALEDLRSLSKRIRVAEKTHRISANKTIASSLKAGDEVEFTLPKTNDVQKGVVAKVKRVMIAVKSVDGSSQWNVPLTSIKKV